MKLGEIKQLLAEHQLQLTKSLGQNFLHDGNQLRRIIRAAELSKKDKVLEVGPGLGPLTELLLENADEVFAIEKDARLVRILTEHFHNEVSANSGSGGRLQLLHDDALEFLRREPRNWAGWKLVANLPYTVASPILVELAGSQSGPERMVATLQLEVAQRLMAKPSDEDYGILTLLIQVAYQPADWFKISASCFFPEPDVDSACVVLVRREQPLLEQGQRAAFAAIVKRSFSQRRKMMAKLLKRYWSTASVERAFAGVPLPLDTRAENVSLEQFVRLTKLLHERGNL
jgi:16S rRNA (adenine1518-N6/adenine1519-N6)-dimethyltransferase